MGWDVWQITMERVATSLWPLLGLTCVLLQLHAAQGRWLGSVSCTPCGPGGVPGLDCYDPPNHPLPPCDFEHQRTGFDCSVASSQSCWRRISCSFQEQGQTRGSGVASLRPRRRSWFRMLPPTQPSSLPPCDFNHQRIGVDCSGWPPACTVGHRISCGAQEHGAAAA